jgi:hypothetical protein
MPAEAALLLIDKAIGFIGTLINALPEPDEIVILIRNT